jgi:hypothetical protein
MCLGVEWNRVHYYWGHYWRTVPAPDDDDDDDECGANGGGMFGKENRSTQTYPSATLSTTNPTSPGLDSNSGHRSGKPATICLSYGTARKTNYKQIIWIFHEQPLHARSSNMLQQIIPPETHNVPVISAFKKRKPWREGHRLKALLRIIFGQKWE